MEDGLLGGGSSFWGVAHDLRFTFAWSGAPEAESHGAHHEEQVWGEVPKKQRGPGGLEDWSGGTT